MNSMLTSGARFGMGRDRTTTRRTPRTSFPSNSHISGERKLPVAHIATRSSKEGFVWAPSPVGQELEITTKSTAARMHFLRMISSKSFVCPGRELNPESTVAEQFIEVVDGLSQAFTQADFGFPLEILLGSSNVGPAAGGIVNRQFPELD